MDDPFTAGRAARETVLGADHVARAEATTTAFDADFQRLITEAAWGRVWARGTISLRERSMLTIALLAALGNEEEMEMHLRATARTGASATDIAEALLHVAIYAGVPRANRAFAIARRVFEGMEEPDA